MTTDNGLAGAEAADAGAHNRAQESEIGDDPGYSVLSVLRTRNAAGCDLLVYDLPQLTGLGLPEAFACVRQLEIDRLIRLDDNPTDAFGAKLTLLQAGIEAHEAETARRAA